MEFVAVLLIAAAVFGVCFLVDKGFTGLFRSKAQHKSGLSVKLNKRYGSMGLVVIVLGVAAIFAGIGSKDGWALPVGGGVLVATGIGLVVHYMSFGVYYDEEAFIVSRFGKPDATYAYRDICAQQLYNNQGHTLVELHLSDGETLQLQNTMTGAYAFLDHAFVAWCKQTGREQSDCAFYDPANSCWFPPVEEE